jgi:hypothetical protein
MSMPDEHEEPLTAFLVVRLWWEVGGTPALRARIRAGLDPAPGEVDTVTVAGRPQLLDAIDRLVTRFEDRCSDGSRNG